MKKFRKSRIFTIATAFLLALCLFCGACDFGSIIPSEHEHSFVNYVSNGDATCTKNGTETAKCEGCEKTDTREAKDSKLGHSFVTYVSNGDATCQKNGTETAKCERCDETDTREEQDSKAKHSFLSYVRNDDATCTTNETQTAKCKWCDETDTQEIADSKKPHSFVTYVPDNNATCTGNGTETAKCEHCNKKDIREIPDSKTEHSYGAYLRDNNATCTANETETATCEHCGKKDIREIPNSKAEHTFTNFIPNGDATSEKDGTKTAKCDYCTATKTVTDEGSKLGGSHTHSYTETTVSPTCEEKGYVLHTCACGQSEYRDGFVDALGHNYKNYTPNNDATCTKNGTESGTCARCGATDTREIEGSKTAHSFVNYISNGDATCTEDGTKTAKCDNCTATDTVVDEGSSTGHSFTHYISNGDATYEKDGTKTAKCDNCAATKTVADVGSKLPPPSADGKPVDGSKDEIAGAKFSIHFLELGNKYTGDSTLIKCGDTEVLIDAGSRKDSGATIKKYVDQYCTDGVLEYVITTHAHQDHIAGFVGNSVNGKRNGILYQYKVGTIIQFALTGSTTQIYKDYCTAVEYAKSRGTTVYTAKQCWYETDGAKKQYFLDDNKTLSMNILYNYYYEHNTDDENDYSVCMLLTNSVGSASYNYLFTGDLEGSGESYLVQYNSLPEVELFKGGHHGSYTASTDKLLNVIKPKSVAVCCCCGTTEYTTNKDNTFPAQAFIDRVSKHTENIYCTTLIVDYKNGEYTSMNGNIIFYFSDRWKLYCTNGNTVLKDTEWFKANRVWRP